MMSTSSLVTFDRILEDTHNWLNDLSADLGWYDKRKVLQALRITLHALHDRITEEQASKLASQFPVLLIGFFYEDWQPAATPHTEGTKDVFLSHVQDQLEQIYSHIDSEQVVRAVFKLIADKTSASEVKDIKSILPEPLKELWPVAVQV